MKNKKIYPILNKTKLIKLKIFKNQFYSQYSNKNILNIFTRIKKAMTVIFQYSKNEKKILIIGLPLNLDSKLKKQIKKIGNIVTPKELWVNGTITNKNNITSHLLKQIKKQIDLIIILDSFEKNEIISESFITKIPIISFNCNLSMLNFYVSYKIPNNLKFTKNRINFDLFYFLILSTLKQAEKYKPKEFKFTYVKMF